MTRGGGEMREGSGEIRPASGKAVPRPVPETEAVPETKPVPETKAGRETRAGPETEAGPVPETRVEPETTGMPDPERHLLARTLELSGMGIWDLDLRQHRAWRSLPHDEIFGYKAPLPTWTYEMFLDHVLPEDRSEVDRKFEEAISLRRDWEFQCRIRRADGAVRWIWARGRGEYDAGGEPVRMLGVVQDITSRKEAEIALEEMNERFRVLSEAMPQMVWSAAPTGRFDYCNHRAYEYLGLAPHEDASSRWTAVIHPDDVPVTVEGWGRALKTGEIYAVEHRLRRSDGVYRWHLTRGVPVRDEEGRLVRWIGTATDIHEHREAEVALRESEARYRLLLETIPDALIVHRGQRVLFANAAAVQLCGARSLEELRSRDLFDIAHPDERAAMEAGAREIEAGGHPGLIERRIVSPRGGEAVVEVAGVQVIYQGKPAVQVVLRDITDRKRMEQALAESQKKFQALIETNVDFVWEMDAEGRYTYCSPQMEALWGLKPEEMIGRTPIDLVPPDQKQAALEGFLSVFRNPAPFHGIETTSFNARGEPVVIEISGVPFFDDTGAVLGFRGTTRDITDRKQAEQALAQRAAELKAANAMLIEADEQKNRFLATLSHELRNPLAPVKNSLYVLDRVAPGSDQAQRAKAVIQRQVGQLSRLVDDLLDVTRIASGKIRLERHRLDLNELTRRTVDDHRVLFQESTIGVVFAPAEREVFVHADRNRIAQVLGNLLQNAAKFTSAGRVTVTVSTEPEARQAVVRVADTGVGVTPEMLGRLFQPFAQGDATLARSQGGLGLGLALAKGLVEQHDGSIEVTSDGPGLGAEFTIRLPLDAAQAPWSGGTEPHVAHKSRRVLIIEDGIDTADSLRELLQLEGHQVAVAYTGPDGISKAHEFHPELVLCDIGLPGMDGYQVARSFRADATLKGVHLVALSGHALPRDLQDATEAGFDLHIAKPPDLAKLRDVLNRRSHALGGGSEDA